jgi:hypothetical protein
MKTSFCYIRLCSRTVFFIALDRHDFIVVMSEVLQVVKLFTRSRFSSIFSIHNIRA